MAEKPRFKITSGETVSILIKARAVPNLVVVIFKFGLGIFVAIIQYLLISYVLNSNLVELWVEPEVIAGAAAALYLVVTLYNYAWPLSGFERLRISNDWLRYEWGFLRVPIRSQKYPLKDIFNIRLATQAQNDIWRFNLWSRPPSLFYVTRIGMLSFDCGTETYSFCVSATYLEAKLLKDYLEKEIQSRVKGPSV